MLQLKIYVTLDEVVMHQIYIYSRYFASKDRIIFVSQCAVAAQ